MTTNRRQGATLIYAMNALAAADLASTTDIVRAGESGAMIDYIFERAAASGIEVAYLNWATDNPAAQTALDDMFARWTNASDIRDYGLPDDVSGWLWLSSMTVDALFVQHDEAGPAVDA